MINFTDIELLQLQFCMKETKKMMCHPSEHMRHASITKKVEDEMEKRKEAYPQSLVEKKTFLYSLIRTTNKRRKEKKQLGSDLYNWI